MMQPSNREKPKTGRRPTSSPFSGGRGKPERREEFDLALSEMSIRVMIIDEQADFRSLLMHHVTTHWPDAVISAYDPTEAGHLPDEFSGAGNDVILLGDRHGEDRDGIDVLRRFTRKNSFPPVIYFAAEDDDPAIGKLAPDALFRRDGIDHATFVQALGDVLRARHRAASSSFDDLRTGAPPTIKRYRIMQRLSLIHI